MVRRLIVHDDLEGWLCSTACERRWWGASDLIAAIQAEDTKQYAVRQRRIGKPLLWEERTAPHFEDEAPAWASFTPGLDSGGRFRDALLARMGGERLKRLIREWAVIRQRPHRMLGGRPKELPTADELEGHSK